MTGLAVPARLEAHQGKQWWRCPSCGAKLGLVTGSRVIIQIGERRIRMPVSNHPEQDCHHCGETSRLGDVA